MSVRVCESKKNDKCAEMINLLNKLFLNLVHCLIVFLQLQATSLSKELVRNNLARIEFPLPCSPEIRTLHASTLELAVSQMRRRTAH